MVAVEKIIAWWRWRRALWGMTWDMTWLKLRIIWGYRKPTDAEMEWHSQASPFVPVEFEAFVAAGCKIEERCTDKGVWWRGDDEWEFRVVDHPEAPTIRIR